MMILIVYNEHIYMMIISQFLYIIDYDDYVPIIDKRDESPCHIGLTHRISSRPLRLSEEGSFSHRNPKPDLGTLPVVRKSWKHRKCSLVWIILKHLGRWIHSSLFGLVSWY